MDYKICTKCGKKLEATTEFFYKRKSGKFGLRADCKTCRTGVCKKYNKNNKKKLALKQKTWRNNNPEKVVASKRKYYINHKEKICDEGKKWRNDNKERCVLRNKLYCENHKEEIKIYYQNNKKKHSIRCKIYYEKHKKELITKSKKWRKNNPDKKTMYNAKRRARKLNQTPELTQQEKEQVTLYYKMSSFLGPEFHVDHVIPLSKGGEHAPWNLQIIPAEENLKKSAKLDYVVPEHLVIKNILEEV